MDPKPIYDKRQWVLGYCSNCGKLNYVEPHGVTAVCKRCGKDVEHKPIPMELRDQSGVYVVVARKGKERT